MNTIKEKEYERMLDRLTNEGIALKDFDSSIDEKGKVYVSGNGKSFSSNSVTSVYYWIKNQHITNVIEEERNRLENRF